VIDSNEISIEILKNSLNNNKISHAYLFETDSSLENNELIFSFIKKIICPYPNNKICETCNICRRIDNQMYPDLKIIEPDGLWIKKEQLIDLQKQFNKKSIESKNMVYVIQDADKMNVSAANTILKFLEEPEEGIVAILITKNVNNMLKTIVSRCQLISLKSKCTLQNDYNEDEIKLAIEFLQLLEKYKYKSIVKIDNALINKICQRENIIKFFEIILLIYTDILHYTFSNSLEMFNDFNDELNKIIDNNNNKNSIYKKLNIIIDINKNLKYNTNTNLILDKFVIEFSGVD